MKSRRFVICDIEATGLDEDKDLIEIALITLEEDKVVDVYETLINPLRPVSEFIQNLTSISSRDLAVAPKFYDVADSIRMRIEGNTFVSHNTDFDLSLLQKKYLEMGQELKVKSYCTLKTSQQEIPGLSNYNLDALCSFFGIKIRERHRAIGDALATLELFKELRDLQYHAKPKILFLPHQEKFLKKIPKRSGLLTFKSAGEVMRIVPAFDMEKTARELLMVKPENLELLVKTDELQFESTGSALIAEFKKLHFIPHHAHWAVVIEEQRGEKRFVIKPFRKGIAGLWFFRDYREAKKKLGQLSSKLQGETYAYREGGKSKEEITRHNIQIEALAKDAKFPSEHLLIVGEGREMGERSLVLIRDGHVKGYGHSKAPLEELYQHPESYLTHKFSRHLGADLAAQKHLRILKNLRTKNESWRSLADYGKVGPTSETRHESKKVQIHKTL